MKFALAILAAVALCQVQASPTQKCLVSPSLTQALASKGSSDIMILLKEQVSPIVDAINTESFVNSASKTTTLVSRLSKFTQAAQKDILSFLSHQKAPKEYKGFWITNRISVRSANAVLVDNLCHNFGDKIEEIREQRIIYLEDSTPVFGPAPKVLEWGVDNIDADLAWPAGFTGEGVITSGIDTGVRHTHNALRDNWRSEYGWFDASTAASALPADSQGHGTHTMGTIAGKDGTGVAPGSQWIHCRAFEGAQAFEEDLFECAEWVACPTLPDGSAADCSKKADVVSNSWGGGNEDPFFNDAINTWRAAEIVPVFAIGNSGPGCRTANSPGDQPNLISVGATNAQNLIASFSSHGPSQTALRIKPEVSAPGNNVRSASNLGDAFYSILSGTSMACPHVAGAVALLKQKNPAATFDQIYDALRTTTLRPEMPDIVCTGGGVDPTDPWPNNSHGWGKINVNNALGAL